MTKMLDVSFSKKEKKSFMFEFCASYNFWGMVSFELCRCKYTVGWISRCS